MINKNSKLFIVLTTLFCVVVVLSNLITTKLFLVPYFPGSVLSAGLLTYPLTFLIGDLVTEIYGPKQARFMVSLGFITSIAANLIVQMALLLPPADLQHQTSFESVFGLTSLIVSASMLAYILAQVVDIQIFHSIKKLTGGKHLWLRNNVSTLASQLIDTFVVNFLFFYWGVGLDFDTVMQITLFAYGYKAIFSICDTPFLYLFVNGAKKYLKDNPPDLLQCREI